MLARLAPRPAHRVAESTAAGRAERDSRAARRSMSKSTSPLTHPLFAIPAAARPRLGLVRRPGHLSGERAANVSRRESRLQPRIAVYILAVQKAFGTACGPTGKTSRLFWACSKQSPIAFVKRAVSSSGLNFMLVLLDDGAGPMVYAKVMRCPNYFCLNLNRYGTVSYVTRKCH